MDEYARAIVSMNDDGDNSNVSIGLNQSLI